MIFKEFPMNDNYLNCKFLSANVNTNTRSTSEYEEITENLRSIHRRCSIKKLLLRISQYLLENTCVKKRLQHRCLPVNFAKFLRISILKNISERLLLKPGILELFEGSNETKYYKIKSFLSELKTIIIMVIIKLMKMMVS